MHKKHDLLLLLLLGARVLQGMDADEHKVVCAAVRDACQAAHGELMPLEMVDESTPMGTKLRVYVEYCGLTPPTGVQHVLGCVTSGVYRLAVHLYRQRAPAKGTALFVHGYMEHTGNDAPLIQHLLTHGYHVAAYDLPGHGLSSGPRGGIGDFREYHAALEDVLRVVEQRLPGPLFLCAHSTGAVGILDMLQAHGMLEVRAVVLYAPLIRSAAWHVSRAGHAITRPFFKEIFRIQRKVTHDRDRYFYLKHGNPLRHSAVPYAWIDALYAWNESVSAWPRHEDVHLLMLQGTGDKVLDWKYNTSLIKEKFPQAEVKLIPCACHQLLLESAPYRRQVYEATTDWFDRF